MDRRDPELGAVLGLAIVALIFAACWGVERLLHKSFPESAKFFWWGTGLGAVFGSVFLIAYLVHGNYIHSALDCMASTIPSGAILGSIPGSLLGLAFGWIWTKFK